MKIPALKTITRVTDLGYEEKPHRHKFCQYVGKLGTTSTTILWLVDMPELEIDTITERPIECMFAEEVNGFRPDDPSYYVKYLGFNIINTGTIDKAYFNADYPNGYIFVSK